MDWQAVLNNDAFLAARSKIPIINLIQGISHSKPADIKYNFLDERAIRICVSEQVADAILETGKVNGPVFSIPNGIDLYPSDRLLNSEKSIDILLVAIKKPDLGKELARKLHGQYEQVCLIDSLLFRDQFLELVSRSRVIVCLPHEVEGFYLPALEGMVLGGLVICPDCIGNRSFCKDQVNCLMPIYNIDSILDSIKYATNLSTKQVEQILGNAQIQASKHTLQNESEQFLAIMQNIDHIW